MHPTARTAIAVIGIDIGKNSFHIVGLDDRGAIVLRQKWSRGQVEARFANMPPCLIGMEACVGAHHLSRKLMALGHDAKCRRLDIVSKRVARLNALMNKLPRKPFSPQRLYFIAHVASCDLARLRWLLNVVFFFALFVAPWISALPALLRAGRSRLVLDSANDVR